MKQKKKYGFPFIMVLFLLVSGIAFAATMKSIQIKKGALRSSPSFLGKVVANVSYGDRVEAVENKNGWSKVKSINAEKTGWIHESALTHKKIVLTSGQTDVEQLATGDEIALAGKGFNEQVEREMRAKYPQMDYTSIDQMESILVSDAEMKAFLEQGRIFTGEGGE